MACTATLAMLRFLRLVSLGAATSGLFPPTSTHPDVFHSVPSADTLVLRSFNFGETEQGSNQCVGGISSASLGLGDNIWLLGDAYVSSIPF